MSPERIAYLVDRRNDDQVRGKIGLRVISASIHKRKKIYNERLNSCVDLVGELLTSIYLANWFWRILRTIYGAQRD